MNPRKINSDGVVIFTQRVELCFPREPGLGKSVQKQRQGTSGLFRCREVQPHAVRQVRILAGSNRTAHDLGAEGSDQFHELLAEILSAQEPDERCGRRRKITRDAFTILELSAAHEGTEFGQPLRPKIEVVRYDRSPGS